MNNYTVEANDCGELETLCFSLSNETVLKLCGNSYIYKDSENLDSGRDVLNFICINSQCSAQLQFTREKKSINLTTGHNMESCTSTFVEWSQSVPALTKTKIKPEEVEGFDFPRSSMTSKSQSTRNQVKLKRSKPSSKRNSERPIFQEGIVNISPQSLDTETPDTSSSSVIAATPLQVLRPIQPPLGHSISISVIPETPTYSLMTTKTGKYQGTPYPKH